MTRFTLIALALLPLFTLQAEDRPPVAPDPAQLTFDLAPDGTVSRNGQPLAEKALADLLAATPKEVPVLIRAADGANASRLQALARETGHRASLAALPQIKPGKPLDNAHPPLDILLQADGYIAIGSETFTPEGLQSRLISMTADGALQPVRLRAQPETPANQIAMITDLLRTIGLTDIAIIAEGAAQPAPIVVDIAFDGIISIAGKAFEIPALTTYLQGAVQGNPGQNVVISAHGNTRVQNVLNVINACKGVGIADVRLKPGAAQ